jgi:excinuclease ABC subunit B
VFNLKAEFPPRGDQPHAIQALVEGVRTGKPAQVLLGITGSGKTFTMANVIDAVQKPTLVIAHNKTLAAQLYAEFRRFFPENAVEYFVSYYDYFQPEAYIARKDLYVEKDLSINEKIDKMRLAATRSLLERKDVIIISSVSCIYGLGLPEYWTRLNVTFEKGMTFDWDALLLRLVEMRYIRTKYDLRRSMFRTHGDVLDIFPGYEEDVAIRVEFFNDEVERVGEIDPLTGKRLRDLPRTTLYPASHHVTPDDVRQSALESILQELQERVDFFQQQGKLEERNRILKRTLYDLEMIRETGSCKGIENYSRHFSRRKPGQPPPCLLDYFPADFLLFVDESHQTVPQMRAMYLGDQGRKAALVEFGFRLPSAFDNRPLSFEEIESRTSQAIYVSATPGEWEMQVVSDDVVEQIIRPTGLLDPFIEVRPADGQVDDCIEEIRKAIGSRSRVLVTTLTKRLAEELSRYLQEVGIAAKYLHSEIDTLERVQIIRDLRLGKFDVLVGINLLREGLDIPEVALVAILEADSEGFLRSATSLIQTCGRAARNVEGHVIMYGDRMTESMLRAIDTTQRRRRLQATYNQEHQIIPTTISREITVELPLQEALYAEEQAKLPTELREAVEHYFTIEEIRSKIAEYEEAMHRAAREYQFEEAAQYRDLMRKYQQMELAYG